MGVSAYLAPWRHRQLINQFARREVLARYRGSLLGLGWALLTPLAMLAVYSLVFHEIFRARWPGSATPTDGPLGFALQLYAGLIVFNLFAELLSRAPRLVLDQPNLVKKVVFPLEVLPWAALAGALFHVAANLLVWGAAIAVTQGGLPATALAVPLVIAACLPLLLGLAWALAALGVFLRDIGQLVGMLMTALMFLSPVFYPATALPERWRPWLTANPLTLPIEQLRRVALEGQWPDGVALSIYALAGLLAAGLGAQFFAATRKGFADVL